MTDEPKEHTGFFSTLINLGSFLVYQFRMWFLPLHGGALENSPEEEDDYEEWKAAKKAEARERRARAVGFLEDGEDDFMDESDVMDDDEAHDDEDLEPLKVEPMIRPPEGENQRVARNASFDESPKDDPAPADISDSAPPAPDLTDSPQPEISSSHTGDTSGPASSPA